MSIANEKIHIDPILGEVLLRKSTRARRVSIRIQRSGGIVVTVPFWVPYAMGVSFLESRREWAREALQRVSEKDSALPEGESVETLRAQAKAVLPPRLRALADRYGFKYNCVTIKHNASNWGSCSTKGNINLNLNLMRVPEPLRDYILLHELTHLHQSNHGPSFHDELERLLADHFSRHADEASYQAIRLAVKSSRARYPYTHVLERSLKQYRLV